MLLGFISQHCFQCGWVVIFHCLKKSQSVPDKACVSFGQMNFFITLCVRETENIIGFEYGSLFLEMVYVNTYNNENNGSCSVLCQYLFANLIFLNFFQDCFLIHQLVLRFSCLASPNLPYKTIKLKSCRYLQFGLHR